MKTFDNWLNACERIGYLDSVTKDGDTYTLLASNAELKKDLTIVERFNDNKQREVLLWSKAEPTKLHKVVGSGLEKVLPRLVVQHFTGLKNVVYSDKDGKQHFFEDVGFFPVHSSSEFVRFSDGIGRKWVFSECGGNVPNVTLAFYKILYDGRTDMSAMMMPRLTRRDDVKLLKNSFGGRQVTVIEEDKYDDIEVSPITSSLDDLMRSIPNLDDMMLFPHQGDVPEVGVSVMSGMAVSAADRAFIASAERRLNGFIGSAPNDYSETMEQFFARKGITDYAVAANYVAYKSPSSHDPNAIVVNRVYPDGTMGSQGWGISGDYLPAIQAYLDKFGTSVVTSSVRRYGLAGTKGLIINGVVSNGSASKRPVKSSGYDPDYDEDPYEDPYNGLVTELFDFIDNNSRITDHPLVWLRDEGAFETISDWLISLGYQESDVEETASDIIEEMRSAIKHGYLVPRRREAASSLKRPVKSSMEGGKQYPPHWTQEDIDMVEGVQNTKPDPYYGEDASGFTSKEQRLKAAQFLNRDKAHSSWLSDPDAMNTSSPLPYKEPGEQVGDTMPNEDPEHYQDSDPSQVDSNDTQTPAFQAFKKTLDSIRSSKIDSVYDDFINGHLGDDEACQMIIAICPECTEPMDLVEDWKTSYPVTSKLGLKGHVKSAAQFKIQLHDTGLFNIDMAHEKNGKLLFSSVSGVADGGTLLGIASKDGIGFNDLSEGVDLSQSFVLPEFKQAICSAVDLKLVKDQPIKRRVESWVLSGKDLTAELALWKLNNPGQVFQSMKVLGVDLDGKGGFKVPVNSWVKRPDPDDVLARKLYDLYCELGFVDRFMEEYNANGYSPTIRNWIYDTCESELDHFPEQVSPNFVAPLIAKFANEDISNGIPIDRRSPETLAMLNRSSSTKPQRLGFNKPLTSTGKGQIKSAFGFSQSEALQARVKELLGNDSVVDSDIENAVTFLLSGEETLDSIEEFWFNDCGWDFEVVQETINALEIAFKEKGLFSSVDKKAVKSGYWQDNNPMSELIELIGEYNAFKLRDAYFKDGGANPTLISDEIYRLTSEPATDPFVEALEEMWFEELEASFGKPRIPSRLGSSTSIQSDFKGLVEMIRGWFQRMKEGLMDQNVFYQNLMRILRGNGYPGPKANNIYKEIMDGKDPAAVMASFKPIQSIASLYDGNVGMVLDRARELMNQGYSEDELLYQLEDDFGDDDYYWVLEKLGIYSSTSKSSVQSGYTPEEEAEIKSLVKKLLAEGNPEITPKRARFDAVKQLERDGWISKQPVKSAGSTLGFGSLTPGGKYEPSDEARRLVNFESNWDLRGVPSDSDLGRALEYLRVNRPYDRTWEAVEEALWNGRFGDDEDVADLAVLVCDHVGIPIASSANQRLGFQKPTQ